MKAQDVIKKNIEEFDKLLVRVDYESNFEKGISYEDRKDIYKPIQNSFKHSHTSLTQAISEDLEEMRVDENANREVIAWRRNGHNKALSQVQEYLKKLI